MSRPVSWKRWEGRSVAGKYPLRQWVGGSDHSAVFLTERPGGARAAIKLVPVEPAGAEQELTRIHATTRLSHPNLIRIFETGRGQVEGDSFLYAVMELADENLAQILPQRALSPDEVSDLLPPLLGALSYLHGKGFVHSRIQPSNILAAGNQLKLSAEQVTPMAEAGTARRRDVYDAPETAAGVLSPASDVWSLGATLVAAITQDVTLAEQISPASNSLPAKVPEPYRSIVQQCLHLDPKRRPTVQQIEARLRPSGNSPAATTRPEPEVKSAPRQVAPTDSSSPRNRKPLIATGIAVLAVVVLFALMHSRGNNPRPSNPSTGNTTVAENKPSAVPESPTPEAPAREPEAAPTPPARNVTPASVQVKRRVVPDIPKSARNTIHGTIKVTVHVDVGPSGKVIAAKFKTSGPSHYFAQKAMKAAEEWEFAPQTETTSWVLSFYFKRNGTDASSQPVSR